MIKPVGGRQTIFRIAARFLFALAALLSCFVAASAQTARPEYQPAPEEQAFIDLLYAQKQPIEAREKALKYLAKHPNSFAADLVAGTSYYQAEGDLPRAYYFLNQGKSILESRYGYDWSEGAPWRFYARTLWQLSRVCERMERYRESISLMEAYNRYFSPKQEAEEAWPLMKLNKEAEARRKIAEGLASKDEEQVLYAMNALGALDSETDHPEESYEDYARLCERARTSKQGIECTFLRNKAESAKALGRYQEAEQLYIESSRYFNAASESNPWEDLVDLYLMEQRLPEALDAAKQMQAWAYHSLPLVGLDNWNLRQTLTAALLSSAGYTDPALEIARRVVDRPDRHGGHSSQRQQWLASSLLFYRQMLLDDLARVSEEISYSSWRDVPGLWVRNLLENGEAWSAGRRGARIIMEMGYLPGTLRQLAPKSAFVYPGGEVYLPGVIGAGVVEDESLKLLARKGAMADREKPYVLLSLGAAKLERGDARGALAALGEAQKTLPAETALLHSELLALEAKAYGSIGDKSGETAALSDLMERDPGMARRLGLSLPCTIAASGGAAASKAADLLRGSPRLSPGGGPFRVVVEQTSTGGLQGGLDGPNGAVLSRFRVNASADPTDTAREFCRLFHQKAFAPNVDLSQQEISSLEGSTLTSQDVNEQLQGLFDTAPPEQKPRQK